MTRPDDAYYPPTWGERFADLEAALAKAESERDAAEAKLEAVRAGLAQAMLGDTDGGLIDPKSDIPAGEMFRLASEFVASVTAAHPSDALAAHDAEVRAAALEDAANAIRQTFSDPDRRRPRVGEFATDLANDPQWAELIVRARAAEERAKGATS